MLIRSARPSSKMPCRTPGTPWPRLSGRVLRHFSPSRRCAFFYRILRSVLSLLPDALHLKYRSLLFRQREKVRFAEEIVQRFGKFPSSISVDRSCHAFSNGYMVSNWFGGICCLADFDELFANVCKCIKTIHQFAEKVSSV